MVGRTHGLSALQDAYMDAHEMCLARVVTLVGEAGLGKSRLMEEFAGWVERRPEAVEYWKARATRETQATPYALLRDLFARRFDILETESAAEVRARFRGAMQGILDPDQADLAGHLAGFDFSASPVVTALLGSPALGQVAAVALRQVLHAFWELGPHINASSVASGDRPSVPPGLLPLYDRPKVQRIPVPGWHRASAQGSRGPVLLLLEDAHWADDASLDLIAGLLGDALRAHLLVVVTTRPELLDRQPNWGGELGAHFRVDMGPFTWRRSLELAAEILQRVPEAPDDLLEVLVDTSGGNPFFLEELVKMLIEDGAIVPGPEQWRIDRQKLGQDACPQR